jgi:formylmethanofuran dehydrogenase subunit D
MPSKMPATLSGGDPASSCAACGSVTRRSALVYRGVRYRRCASCRSSLSTELPTESELRHTYETEYPLLFAPEQVTSERTCLFGALLDRLAALGREQSKRPRLIDVGSGGGHLAGLAHGRRWLAISTDIAHPACAVARRAGETPAIQADGALLPFRGGTAAHAHQRHGVAEQGHHIAPAEVEQVVGRRGRDFVRRRNVPISAEWLDVFRALAKRMGFDDPCFDESEDDMVRGLIGSGHKFLDGITLERLDQEHSVRLNVSPADQPFLPFAQGGFGTASGKCELGGAELDYRPPVESRFGDAALRRKFPLEFVSSKNDDSMNSTFGNRAGVDRQTAVLHLHTTDATSRGIQTGDRVRAFNDRGSLLLTAEVDGVVPPGIVRAPSVRWNKRSADGRNANALTSDRIADMGGGATFYNCLVEVERCGD